MDPTASDVIEEASALHGADRSDLARTVNEQGATAVRELPQQLGLLASLPLPDVDAALEEILRKPLALARPATA